MTNDPLLKSKSIFLVNFDWRDIMRASPVEFHDKLERDRLNPDINDFFVFSWARASYTSLEGRWKTVHKKTRLDKLRPLLDLVTFFLVPITAKKYKIRPDAWIAYDFGSVPALWMSKKLFGGKIILCLNNQPRIYSQTRRFGGVKFFYSWMVEKLFSRLVDRYFTINETMSSYIKSLGISGDRITIFSMNTIARDRAFIDQAKKGSIREKYSIPKDSKIILTVARLEAEKNYPRLLELFAGLGEGYVLIALGRGSLLESLKSQALSLGIGGRVFFPGFVHRDGIWEYYKDADVFALVSKAEALGVVFWEAMYAGIPVIGSDVDGIRESIGESGDKGFIWKDELGEAGFKAIVSKCLNPGSERDAMLKRAKEYVEVQIGNAITINDII